MRIKRKKSKQIKRSPVIFKKKDVASSPRKKSGLGAKLFNRVSSKKSAGKAQKRRSSITSGIKTIGLTSFKLSLPLLTGLIIYLGGKTVVEIRADGVQEVAGVSFTGGEVVGFEEIPAYPGSNFIFKEHTDNPDVKAFLTSGFSVYRLPPNVTDEDAYSYYLETMGLLDWEHVLTVSRADSAKKHGEYWVKGGEGIRIYSQLNDVWYQKVSQDEAVTGLASEVEEEIDRELLLASTTGTELLPDYPWSLTVPREYLVRYYTTKFENFNGLEIRRIGAKESVLIEPIGEANETPIDTYFQVFIDEYNLSLQEEYSALLASKPATKPEEPAQWKVISSSYQPINEKITLISEISDGKTAAKAYSLMNSRSGKIYTIVTFQQDSQILDFVINGIKEKRTSYTQEDYDYD